MKLFSKIIRAIERNSRQNERKKLVEELEDIYASRKYDDARAEQIMERLGSLRRDDSCAYLNRAKPIESVSDAIRKAEKAPLIQIVEDDATPAHHWHGYGNARPTMCHDTTPEGLAGEWKAPV